MLDRRALIIRANRPARPNRATNIHAKCLPGRLAPRSYARTARPDEARDDHARDACLGEARDDQTRESLAWTKRAMIKRAIARPDEARHYHAREVWWAVQDSNL